MIFFQWYLPSVGVKMSVVPPYSLKNLTDITIT